MQSHRHIQSQNRESQAFSEDPLAQAMGMFMAATKDGDQALAAIWFDRLQVLHLQRQVEGQAAIQQLLQGNAGGAGAGPAGGNPLAALLGGSAPNATGGSGDAAAGLAALLGGRAGSANGGRGTTLFNPNPASAAPVTNQSLNPANGAIPFAQAAGVGNQPSPDAGAFSGGQRQSGLLGPDGQPLPGGEGG